ncbi:MAG: ATP-grasp domain-containing protein [Burkholderiaceae bacterium]|jgi:hypothetical protein
MQPVTRAATPPVGIVFDYDWDAVAHRRLAGLAAFDRSGFDLFTWAGRLRLLRLNLLAYADRLAARGRRRAWAAVVSHHELYGALVAALVAERLGLPSPGVRAVLACHHKGYTRAILQQVCPEANLRFAVVDPAVSSHEAGLSRAASAAPALGFPVYLKPVRATFSVLARSIEGPAAWQAHFAKLSRDRWITERLLAPFEAVLQAYLPEAGSSFRFLAEEPVWHPQYNLDGYVDGAGIHLLGVVDAVVYPGTQAFQRWEYPSQLPAAVVDRALGIARKFLTAIGFGQGFFNMEFFYDSSSEKISVIEFNPRLSSQFSDLYRMVSGWDPHAMALALAQGRDPRALVRAAPTARVAASLVWRAFDAQDIPPAPSRGALRRLATIFPDQTVFTFSRSPAAIRRAFSWMESYRYGVVNVGAEDSAGLDRQSAQISEILGWPNAPYAIDLPALAQPLGAAAVRAR